MVNSIGPINDENFNILPTVDVEDTVVCPNDSDSLTLLVKNRLEALISGDKDVSKELKFYFEKGANPKEVWQYVLWLYSNPSEYPGNHNFEPQKLVTILIDSGCEMDKETLVELLSRPFPFSVYQNLNALLMKLVKDRPDREEIVRSVLKFNPLALTKYGVEGMSTPLLEIVDSYLSLVKEIQSVKSSEVTAFYNTLIDMNKQIIKSVPEIRKRIQHLLKKKGISSDNFEKEPELARLFKPQFHADELEKMLQLNTKIVEFSQLIQSKIKD